MKSKFLQLMARRKRYMREGNFEAADKLLEAARKMKPSEKELKASGLVGP
jgi:hypothetical protein